jgi:transposase InsO family protein
LESSSTSKSWADCQVVTESNLSLHQDVNVLRDECLNVTWFRTLNDVCRTVDRWCQEYNCERPHSSLAYQAQREFAALQG